jgi:hypothetical protein
MRCRSLAALGMTAWLGMTLILGCGGATGPKLAGSGRRLLFIGNSHTYTNDVPGMLQALAAAAGPESLAVASNAPPNFALIDHVNGAAPRDIASAPWSMVILQQGWTPAGACRDTLRLAAGLLAGDAKKVNAQVAVYQVWTPVDRPSHMPGTIRSYELAADDVHGLLFPAAAAFQTALRRNPALPLYLDGMHAHASREGSYLVALVMYATIFERTPIGLPTAFTTRAGDRIQIAPATATTLQEAAADVTVRGLGRSNGEDGPVIANPGRC